MEEDKTLIVKAETHKNLMLKKINKGFKSIDEVIKYFFELEEKLNNLTSE